MEPQSGYGGNRGMMSDGTEIYTPIQLHQNIQMDDDALALKQNQPLLVPGEEGLRDIRVVEAIYRSAKGGGCELKI